MTGLTRGGDVSCGGGTRLLPCADGWVAVSLTRDGRLGCWWRHGWARARPVDPGDWATVSAAVAGSEGDELRAGAELLGLPVGVLGERRPGDRAAAPSPGDVVAGSTGSGARHLRSARSVRSCAELMVVDLSSLWAGPLAGRLLAPGRGPGREGRVDHPAGRSPPWLTALLPAPQRGQGVGGPRLRLDRRTPTARPTWWPGPTWSSPGPGPGPSSSWASTSRTGSAAGRPGSGCPSPATGRRAHRAGRVAFGDDAAVAGGLVAWDGDGPCFCGDAVADPTTGLASAVAVLTALAEGGAWVLDASMADIAGGPERRPGPPRGRAARRPAPRPRRRVGHRRFGVSGRTPRPCSPPWPGGDPDRAAATPGAGTEVPFSPAGLRDTSRSI